MNYYSVVFVIVLLVSMDTSANRIPPAYREVANKFNLPEKIFFSIALTESGYKKGGIYNPWPWTLNIEGMGYRFDSYQETLEKLYSALAVGKKVDIGIMQVNSYWHKQRVNHLQELLNPHTNLDIAAMILMEQRNKSRNWWDAVGRYHAPARDEKSKRRAEQYRQRVRRIYNTL